jgi:hypothetical protein
VVIGAVIDLNNQYGFGLNRLIITNINGETEPERLRAMHHLVRLNKRLLDMVGRKAREEEHPEAQPAVQGTPTRKKTEKKVRAK